MSDVEQQNQAARAYMTSLQAVKREVNRELDRAQLGQPTTTALPHAFADLAQARSAYRRSLQ